MQILMMRDNYDFSQGIKNPHFDRLKKRSKKQSLTLYLDDEIVNWYKQNEVGHQTEINHLLREYIKHH